MANMTNRDPSRSALSAAGQSSLLSPRPAPNNVIDAQPVYATSYPFPGASTLVKNTFPNTSQPDSKSLQQTVSEGNQFRQISPRTRADRRTIESKDELARQRCIQRNDGYHRLPHQNNYNYHNPFDLGEQQPTTWKGTVDDRYAQNSADMLRSVQDDKRVQTVNHRAARRDKIMQDEAVRWQGFDAAATKDRQRWDDIRAESLKAKANLSSLPYDPVTLRTKDSIDGLQYEYEEGKEIFVIFYNFVKDERLKYFFFYMSWLTFLFFLLSFLNIMPLPLFDLFYLLVKFLSISFRFLLFIIIIIGLMKYREQLRSKNLYGKYNANGFNPVNGVPLYMGDMPTRPPNVQELAVQRDAVRNTDAVSLIKKKIVEAGGMNGIRRCSKMFRLMDQVSKSNALPQNVV